MVSLIFLLTLSLSHPLLHHSNSLPYTYLATFTVFDFYFRYYHSWCYGFAGLQCCSHLGLYSLLSWSSMLYDVLLLSWTVNFMGCSLIWSLLGYFWYCFGWVLFPGLVVSGPALLAATYILLLHTGFYFLIWLGWVLFPDSTLFSGLLHLRRGHAGFLTFPPTFGYSAILHLTAHIFSDVSIYLVL